MQALCCTSLGVASVRARLDDYRPSGVCRGDFGRLGQGHTDDLVVPRAIASLSGRAVRSLACGDMHTAVLLQDGSLLTFGRNQNGQLGLGTREDRLEPASVDELAGTRIVGVSCGAEHTVCVSDEGRAYAWGWGRYGNLGLGSSADACAVSLFHLVLFPHETLNCTRQLCGSTCTRAFPLLSLACTP